MKYNLFKIFSIFFLKLNCVYSDEIIFKSENIKISNNGNIVEAVDVEADLKDKEIIISGKNSIYEKQIKKLTIKKNVKIDDISKNIFLRGDNVIYDLNIDRIRSVGKTYINVDKKYEITSKNLIYDREKYNLSNNETTIREGNV